MKLRLRQLLCRGTVQLLSALEFVGLFQPKADTCRFTTPAIVHRERYRAFQAFDVSPRQPARGVPLPSDDSTPDPFHQTHTYGTMGTCLISGRLILGRAGAVN